MKKILLISLMVTMILALCLSSTDCSVSDARGVAEEAQRKAADSAITAIPIPTVLYFQEKRTIAKWATTWDKPSIVCYIYLFAYGNCIGYYVADGKPASTQSYMMPEESYYQHGNGVVMSNPDIDGTWGSNNPGIRFFTAEGAAVEWAGSGASYLFSNTPLTIRVPKLNTVIDEKE